MEGLEIIEYIAIERVPDLVMTCLLLGVFSILIPTFVVYRLTKNGIKAFLTEILSAFIYLVVLIGLLGSGALEKPTGEYQYRVVITEDVSYVEFTDKYDVVTENDDGTYIIQEKNHIKE
jgi:hypothetical protein